MYTIIGDSMKDNIYDYINYVFIEKKLSNNTKDAYLKDLLLFNEYLKSKDVKKFHTMTLFHTLIIYRILPIQIKQSLEK